MSKSAEVKIGPIIECPCGESGKTSLACQSMLHETQHHPEESIKSMYGKVYLDPSPWGREAGTVYEECLKEHNPIPEMYASAIY